MTIKTLVFDFGNVIGFFDRRLVTKRLQAYTQLQRDDLYRCFFRGELEDDYECGRVTTVDFLRQVRQAGGLSCSEDLLTAAYTDIFWPNPAVCDLLPRLKPSYRLLLGSNTNELHSQHFRRQFAKTFQHFDHLILSHEVGARKPKAAFFEHCLRLANCRPAECLFIDDLPTNVAGARACGLQGIVYTGIDDLRHRLAEHGVAT